MNNKTYFTVTGAVILVSIGFLILALRCGGDGGGAPSDKVNTPVPLLPSSESEKPAADDASKNDAKAQKGKTKIEKDESKN